ncbi:hypothetical protein RF11_00357 [Thelohanellus kitauei]|uniref:Uncharacterized protein n=1 Tax=Thelohanellus kitauei TaxID=669202 RepID=A0A0C2MLL0_THEKT|nr:hypothetical protein RF11_00357 [Thelohanellus kitauei]
MRSIDRKTRYETSSGALESLQPRGAPEALWVWSWTLEWTGSRWGDKMANHPGSSHGQRGANFYKNKMLNYNKNPIELRNIASTPEVDYRRSQEESTVTRGSEFILLLPRDSVSSGKGGSKQGGQKRLATKGGGGICMLC